MIESDSQNTANNLDLESLRQVKQKKVNERDVGLKPKKERAGAKSFDLKMAQRFIEELQTYQEALELQNVELRSAQKSLELARDQYAELYHEAPVGYVTLDDNGRIVEVNRTVSKLLGVPISSLKDRPFSAYVARIDSSIYFEFLDLVLNETSADEPHSLELRLGASSDVQTYVELAGTHYLEVASGKRLFRLVLKEIEERKKLEARQRLLQAAVEYSTDGISISDMRLPDNPIIYASPKLEEISGYSADELEGGNWRMLYAEEPDEEARSLMREAFSLGRECRAYVRNLRKDGSPFYCEVTLYPLTDRVGLVTHYVSVIRDITEKRKTDQAIFQAQRLDSIGILAGGIAHDFNNILHGVMVQSTLALKRLEDEHPARANVKKAYQATRRAADLTRQLLSYAGRGDFKVNQIDLNQLIPEIHQLVLSTIPSEVTIEMEMTKTPLIIEADSGQVQQVLLNLIMNAGQAINARGKIIVRSKRFIPSHSLPANPTIRNGEEPRQLDPQKVYALIEVEDDGCGMDEDTLSKVFDPFFTTKELGNGLGLAVAFEIVRTQNGKIQVESRPNTGTKISVYLPLTEEQEWADLAAPEQASEDRIAGKPTILIVDDDSNVRETLDSALEFLGCSVISASNGADGIRLYQMYQEEIDLVLMDFHMPGMNGEETFLNLQKLNREIRCVFSSGFTQDKIQKTIGHKDGRIDYLQKPYDLQALKNVISQILDC